MDDSGGGSGTTWTYVAGGFVLNAVGLRSKVGNKGVFLIFMSLGV
jgi:hypothetical protein